MIKESSIQNIRECEPSVASRAYSPSVKLTIPDLTHFLVNKVQNDLLELNVRNLFINGSNEGDRFFGTSHVDPTDNSVKIDLAYVSDKDTQLYTIYQSPKDFKYNLVFYKGGNNKNENFSKLASSAR